MQKIVINCQSEAKKYTLQTIQVAGKSKTIIMLFNLQQSIDYLDNLTKGKSKKEAFLLLVYLICPRFMVQQQC